MNIIIWILIVIGILIFSVGLTIITFIVITKIKDNLKIKKKLPKDKKQVSEYIKANDKFFLSKPLENIDKKEVEEDDRRRFDKIREFEKLRRVATNERRDDRKRESNNYYERDAELQRRELLQNKPDSIPPGHFRDVAKERRKLKLDD